MDLKQRFYPESRFGGFTRFDGTIAFYSRIQALLKPEMVLVDFGCGRGAYQEDPIAFRRDLRIFKGRVQRVIGLDVSPAGVQNPYLDEFCQLNGETWPLKNATVDMIVCDQVLEHLPNPEQFFREARRVLKPGGMLCIRTPNRWNYVALISRLVPNRMHSGLLTRVKSGLKDEDIFPTLYHCNTIPALKQSLARNGFDAAVFGFEPEPSYLSFSPAAYWLGTVHQKLAPQWLKPVLFAFGRLIMPL